MATIRHKGSFKNTEKFMNRLLGRGYLNDLAQYGEAGVQALANSTPRDTGETSKCWNFEIERGDGSTSLSFNNTNNNHGVNIVNLLVNGHGTRNGGYVPPNAFVTPAIQPIFDALANAVWKEVTKRE